ncbi:MAG TPA: hypothetical protein VGM21_03585 [Actinomycetota bacterium]|jgi:hypothetical protein
MNDRQRAILQDVADGRIPPDEAARLLDEVGEPATEGPEERPSVQAEGIARVRLVQAFRPARVVGDPDVAEAVVEGPHLAEREGDALVVHGDEVPGVGGFAFSHGDRPWYPSRPGRPGQEQGGHWRRGRWEAHRGPGPLGGPPGAEGAGPWGGPPGWPGRWALLDAFRRFGDELTIRMRPDLALDAGVTAGSLKVAGLTGPLRVSLAGGSARVERFAGPLDLAVEAGSLRGSGLLTAGSSRVRCQAGSVRLHLERGSSVKVRARAELGNVVLPGDADGERWLAGGGGEAREVTVGDGEALLEIEVNMGSVVVSADR